MTPFVLFDPETGVILRRGYAPADAIALVRRPNESIKIGKGRSASHFVDPKNGEIQEKKPILIKPNKEKGKPNEEMKFTDLPEGAQVTFFGPNGKEIAKGMPDTVRRTRFKPKQPGRYRVRVEHPHYLPADLEFDVSPQ